MPLQSKLLENLAVCFTENNTTKLRDPRYLPPPTYGYSEDTEYEYIHPNSVEGHQLQARGYRLPTPSTNATIAPPSTRAQLDPLTYPSLPPISSLLHSPASPAPLSSNIVNTVSAQPAPATIPARKAPEQHADARKLIASSASGKQNPSAKGGASKKKYSSQDLVLIARAVIEEMPFLAPYGEKTNTWNKVNENLHENGFRHAISTDQLRLKAEGLVLYKKNPSSTDEKVRSVATLLNGSTDAITIAALLERMETQWDEAQEASDGKKSEIKKKHEADRLGGESLRKASMQTLNRKHCAAESVDTDDETGPVSSATASQSSVDIQNVVDEHPRKSKRRRLADPTLEFQEELIVTLRQEMKSREQYQKATDERLESFMESSKKQGEELCDILKGLIEVERARALARQPSVEV